MHRRTLLAATAGLAAGLTAGSAAPSIAQTAGRKTIRLAGELGVTKIVTMSGNPGDGPGSTAVNFTWYPWPDDSMALLDRQWD